MEGMEFVVVIVAIVFGSKLIRDLAYGKKGITPRGKGKKGASCAFALKIMVQVLPMNWLKLKSLKNGLKF